MARSPSRPSSTLTAGARTSSGPCATSPRRAGPSGHPPVCGHRARRAGQPDRLGRGNVGRSTHDHARRLQPRRRERSGLELRQRLGQSLEEIFPTARWKPIVDLVWRRRPEPGPTSPGLPLHGSHGSRPHLSLKALPLASGRVGLAAEDVTVQEQSRALNAAEQRVLGLVASGATLEKTLTELILAIEELTAPGIASVLLLRRRARRAAALPPISTKNTPRPSTASFIGPTAGSCGTAAALRRSVIITDIDIDPLWADYRPISPTASASAPAGRTSSSPAAAALLGAFAIYYREPRSPTPGRPRDHRARRPRGPDRHRATRPRRAAPRPLCPPRCRSAREERTGIAREIHDQLGQMLTVREMDLAQDLAPHHVRRRLSRAALLDKVKELSQSTDSSSSRCAASPAELRGVLDDLGLRRRASVARTGAHDRHFRHPLRGGRRRRRRPS